MTLFEKHKETLEKAINANQARLFWANYSENPKTYGEDAMGEGFKKFQSYFNADFTTLHQQNPLRFEGEEISPYLQTGIGVGYPIFADKILSKNAKDSLKIWRKVSVEDRAAILIESLDRISKRFFEIAYATMHTTGQSFMMSFQASGPHAADRALEAVAMGYNELKRFPTEVVWDKPMGKYNITVKKNWQAVPKGVSLVIGCSTFPTWNTVPGMFASLITGNTVIVKPHPKAILPIAIFIEELQNVLVENNLPAEICQLGADTSEFPIAKELIADPNITLIDYTGNTIFGNWIETQQIMGKTVFTEKAGVNSVILESTDKYKEMLDNLAFSVCLYSGQMCTAPQNFFIPADGIDTNLGHKTYDEIAADFKTAINNIVDHPKMGPGVLGAIQNDNTVKNLHSAKNDLGTILLESKEVANPEFENIRSFSPMIAEVDSTAKAKFEKELFGPIALLIKTNNFEESLRLAKEMALKHGAISCAAYSKDDSKIQTIADEMAEAFTPVSFNFTGGIYVNQNAAFSDFHVTGGNPAGNASFTDPSFINKRFVWVGHKFL